MQKNSVRSTRTALVGAIVSGLIASAVVAAPAQAAPTSTAISGFSVQSNLDFAAQDLERGLTLIDAIPESVLLAGDEALRSWISTNRPDLLDGSRADIVGCAGAIAWLIASTAIPAAKILKIKKLINTLGGVGEAVKVFWGASFSWEKIHALGGAAAALGAELLGISAVQQKCFS